MKNKRITFVGNFNVDFSSESHHAKSLEALGYEVVRLQEGFATTDDILLEGLQSGLVVWVHTHGWATTGEVALHILFNRLKFAQVPVISYHLDLWFGLRRQQDLRRDPFYARLNYFFTVDKLMADWFNNHSDVKGVFLPAGVFDQEVKMLKPKKADYDIIFVGSKGYHPEWPYRPQLVQWLKDTYGDKFLHIGGDGDTGIVRGMELNQLYANAKIAIGDSLNINFNYPFYTSDRLFESTGRGGFTIYPEIEGLSDWYVPDKEVVFYKHGDFDDLKKKIDYYLTHPKEREAIRKAGFERAKKDHTYVERWREIMGYFDVKS